MVESEVTPESAAAAGAAPAAGKKAPPKPKVKRLDRPSRELLEEQCLKLEAEIEKNQQRINAIKEIIAGRRQGKRAVSAEMQMARNRLADLKAQFRLKVEEKNAIRAELQQADAARNQMRAEAKTMKDKLPFVSVEEIDNEVSKLEYKIAHTSLPLQEEKKIVSQIKELRKSREFVKDYHDRREKIQTDEGARVALTEQIKAKDAEINAVKEQEQEQRMVCEAIREREEAAAADIPTLEKERDECYAKIQQIREARSALRKEFKEKEDEWRERENEWWVQQREEKQRRYEAAVEQRKAREEQRKAREAEYAVEPYTDEILACEQLITYVQKFVTEDGNAGEGSGDAPGDTSVAAKGGLDHAQGFGARLVRKAEKDEDYFSGTKKGGKKSKGEDKKKAAKGAEKIVHSLDALQSFQNVKVTPPTSAASVPDKVAELKARIAHYLQLRKEKAEKAARAAEAGVDVSEGGAAEEGSKTNKEGKEGGSGSPRVASGKGRRERGGGKMNGGGKRGGPLPPVSVSLICNGLNQLELELTVNE
eukprot:jgi/Mesvir1/3328/Mv13713-RA.1